MGGPRDGDASTKTRRTELFDVCTLRLGNTLLRIEVISPPCKQLSKLLSVSGEETKLGVDETIHRPLHSLESSLCTAGLGATRLQADLQCMTKIDTL